MSLFRKFCLNGDICYFAGEGLYLGPCSAPMAFELCRERFSPRVIKFGLAGLNYIVSYNYVDLSALQIPSSVSVKTEPHCQMLSNRQECH